VTTFTRTGKTVLIKTVL